MMRSISASVAGGYAYMGTGVISPGDLESILAFQHGHDKPSPRERGVVQLIAEGLSAPQIGRTLHLSTATVKTHLQHIYGKLGVSERAAAVAEAMRRGLLE